MRAFGTEISGNRRIHAELSILQRSAIIAKAEAGVSYKELAAEFQCSKSCISKTIQRWNKHAKVESPPRSGRPEKANWHEKRALWRLARKFPKMEYKNLMKETSLKHVHRNTIYNIPRERGP
ncbi:hypothetical protein K469DRAFT_768342 [Zopfia rhizophila CBS 207.26]|uniref:Transposase IS30-like HTH domain-containing protein n=1 Tax=Zopfia rhizophila CBS 207.26 TaxID=1314779 RepID=A0A6A6DAI6_9PEZI|nr:hypothetical protein K469DRAFT_768342 [Zopfia rhizophila CBS 207.26]